MASRKQQELAGTRRDDEPKPQPTIKAIEEEIEAIEKDDGDDSDAPQGAA